MPNLNTGLLRETPLTLPNIGVQRAIAATLGALDDKIESNRGAKILLRKLGEARFEQALNRGNRRFTLNELVASIARGVSPSYADGCESAPQVINQRCIRDGWVSLAQARKMHARKTAPEKQASSGDILVNSTGIGTLGRLARWHEGQIYVDSHVAIVKPDPTKINPVVLAYALFGSESYIEDLATGSTGQTELSPARLGSLLVEVPSANSDSLSDVLLTIEQKAGQVGSEILALETLRDALLPELLSGRIRVPVETPS